jgi:hypothetical protein
VRRHYLANTTWDAARMVVEEGLEYGPAFQSLTKVEVDAGARAALACLSLPEAAPDHAGFMLHPALLDGALQGLFALMLGQG